MKLEINQEHLLQVQESFNRHLEEITEGFDITGAQMELSSCPEVYHRSLYNARKEKRTFTYEGYTQSHKKFTLTIED